MWWAELPPPAGRRPVLLLSRDEAYPVRSLVTVAPITTRIRGIPVEVPLSTEDGLPRPCVVNLDSIVTIAKAHLQEHIAPLSRQKMKAAERSLRFALELE